jgi:hypothetical protein
MHACAGIGGAGPAGDERHTGATGQLAVGLGHHRRAAFLLGSDSLDPAVMQRVEHGEIALARHAEHPLGTLRLETFHQYLPACRHDLLPLGLTALKHRDYGE